MKLSQIEKYYWGNDRYNTKYERHKLENSNGILDMELDKSFQQLQVLIKLSDFLQDPSDIPSKLQKLYEDEQTDIKNLIE